MSPDNTQIARLLDEVADLLETQEANPFRARAYRRAAAAVRAERGPAADRLAAGGSPALREIPGVGERLARAIVEIVETGDLGQLHRLRGQVEPDVLLTTVPGLDVLLARRIHEQLGVETLEELEVAAHDGRLRSVRGMGPRRIRTVADHLAVRLARRRRAVPTPTAELVPPVAELLDVDREYREKAAAGTLRTIAPRRFNPGSEAWLPVLHTERDARHYTALFSNTGRAHELGTTRDWVVLYLADDGGERQATVVTEARGPLRGRRVVRGRERECAVHYGIVPSRQMLSRAALVLVALLVLLAGTTRAAAPSPRDAGAILDQVDDLFRGRSSQGRATMTVTTAHWTRALTLEFWNRGTDRSLVRIVAPQKEKGTATLRVGNDLWNYLPKVKRTIKLPSSMLQASWMGSHFTNDDLVKESRMTQDYTFTITFDGTRDGQRSLEITCTPRPDAAVVWGQVVVRVREPDHLPLAALFYDEHLQLARTMTYADVRPLGGRELPTRLVVVPTDAPAESTVVVYEDIHFDAPLADEAFSLRALEQ